MKKNKKTTEERKAVIKRGVKRCERLKKTQKEKGEKKTFAILEKKKLKERQNQEIEKILKSKQLNGPADISKTRFKPMSFTQSVYMVYRKKTLESKKKEVV